MRAPRASAADLPLLGNYYGEAPGDHFGLSVSAVDADADGAEDLVIGARDNDAGGTDAGRVYLVRGGDGGGSGFALIVTGQASGARLGSAVAGAGDVNGDGCGDFMVAADGVERVYLFLGSAQPDSTPDLCLEPEAGGGGFGTALAAADLDGDGFSDLLVGAPLDGSAGAQAGRVYVFRGAPAPDAEFDLVVEGRAAGDRLGSALAAAGDVDHDGISDAVIGARHGGAQHGGQAVLLRGANPLDAHFDLTYAGEAADDDFGFSVAGAGDVDGDGHADVLVGAPLNDAAGIMSGRAYLFLGGSPPDSVPDLVLTGRSSVDELGYAVATAGDVDRDGFDDVLVSAPLDETGGAKAGRAFVYLGGQVLDNHSDLVFTGDSAVDELGVALAHVARFAGVDSDALALGIWLDDSAGVDAGRVEVRAQRRVAVGATLTAAVEGEGVRVKWSFVPSAAFSALWVDRAGAGEPQTIWVGPAEASTPGGECLDPGVAPGTWTYILKADARGGTRSLASATVSIAAADGPDPGGPAELQLLAVGPSPSTGVIHAQVRVRRAGVVTLEVFDAAGRRVAERRASVAAGVETRLQWDGRDHAGRPARSGTYWLRVRSGAATRARAVVLTR